MKASQKQSPSSCQTKTSKIKPSLPSKNPTAEASPKKKKPPAARQKQKKKTETGYAPDKTSFDENYDGYYDDRPTDDNMQNSETVDSELIKKIILLSAGAVLVIILSILLMNLL